MPAAVLLVRGDSWLVSVMQDGEKAPKWKASEVTFRVPIELGEQVPVRVNEVTKK